MRKFIQGENAVEIIKPGPDSDYALLFFYSPARCETTKLIVPAVMCRDSLIFVVDTCVAGLKVGDYNMTVYLQDNNTNYDPIFARFYYSELVQIRADVCKAAC